MSSIGYKFNVLWIDDQPSAVLADYALAAYGININSIENYSDGIKWLRENQNKCDAVILDVNCKHSRSEEIPSMKVFTNNLDQIKELCKGKRFIPWFVYTGGPLWSMQSVAILDGLRNFSTRNQFIERSCY